MKSASSRFAILILTTSLAGSGCGSEPGSAEAGRGRAEVPAPVVVGPVVQKDVPVVLRAFGTVEPLASVEVRSQVGGELMGVHFEQGQDVAKGDLLFTIDSRPAKARLKLAQANVARDRVRAQNAREEANRRQALFDRKLVSQEVLDEARAEADALAAAQRANEAAVSSAKLEVEYSAIRSPIAGRTGVLEVHRGNLVKANDGVLVTINQLTPIRVAFALPQRDLPAVMARLESAEEVAVSAFVPGDDAEPERGALSLVDNAVDRATGTIRLWAVFENARQRLWPGQLVNVALTLEVQIGALAIATSAVQTGQKGTYVFVVKPDSTVEERPIEVLRAYGDETVIAGGLAAGERVVTDGQLRLKPGSRVVEKAPAEAVSTTP